MILKYFWKKPENQCMFNSSFDHHSGIVLCENNFYESNVINRCRNYILAKTVKLPTVKFIMLSIY